MKVKKQKNTRRKQCNSLIWQGVTPAKANKMSMTFIFDEEKIKRDNVEVHPLSRMRNYFNSFKIKETSVGTFEGTDEDFTQFASRVFHMPDYPWFMDYIKEWYWDARDGREDVLKGIEKAKNPDNYPNLNYQNIKPHKMSMTFIFDEEKIKRDNVEVHPLSRMRNYFNSFKIKETSVGTFEGTDEDFTQFASRVFHMPDYPWFMDYIKEWYWDARDGREDVLKEIADARR